MGLLDTDLGLVETHILDIADDADRQHDTLGTHFAGRAGFFRASP